MHPTGYCVLRYSACLSDVPASMRSDKVAVLGAGTRLTDGRALVRYRPGHSASAQLSRNLGRRTERVRERKEAQAARARAKKQKIGPHDPVLLEPPPPPPPETTAGRRAREESSRLLLGGMSWPVSSLSPSALRCRHCSRSSAEGRRTVLEGGWLSRCLPVLPCKKWLSGHGPAAVFCLLGLCGSRISLSPRGG